MTSTVLRRYSMPASGASAPSRDSGFYGYGVSDVADPRAARRQGQGAGSSARSANGPAGAVLLWRYYRDFDPNLASIRNEPEFKAVFADIERDMAQQRAAPRRASRRMRRSSWRTLRGDRHADRASEPRASGPTAPPQGGAVVQSPTSLARGGCCRASSTSRTPTTGPSHIQQRRNRSYS